ncbi:MAG: hypothetical protein KJO11_16730 [Gemmatimonadetes bacterium]|nr:hypothetical protein [Gemmatimonadota bacterium]
MSPSLRLAWVAPLAAILAAPGGESPPRWGADGHVMAGRAALARVPDAMPEFFRESGDQLSWLNPEPDRWRSRELRPMDQGFSYDHYIDFENVPGDALDAPDRWRFIEVLYGAGLIRPERDVGFLPYRIEELYQRLLTGFRLWRDADGDERRWIEARIINDAGVLGHYVTDGSQPHHTTIHFNGWNASGAQQAPNPEGFTEERDFHGRFESDFVREHLAYNDVFFRVPRETRFLGTPDEVRDAVRAFLRDTHAEVATLYRLEKSARFDPDSAPPTEHVEFTAERLAAGAAMLRDLWWSAWRDSARPPSER